MDKGKKAGKLRSAAKAKDLRPLSDANYQKDQLTGVFKYLVTHKYNLPVALTQLMSQGKQEIWSAITFLLKQVHSDRFVRSFAELPTVGKELGYPYILSSGAASANYQATLGFLFWLCDLLRLMAHKPEDHADPVTLYLFNSYAIYLEEKDEDKREAERARLFAAIQGQQMQTEFEKVELRKAAEELETCRRGTPTHLFSQLEEDTDRLETENQIYLMEVLAPLDETRNQLKAASLRPSLAPQLQVTMKTIDELEQQSELLAAEYAVQVRYLQQAGLEELSQNYVAESLCQSQEQLQEWEHQQLSLSAEVSLLNERKQQLLADKETARWHLLQSLQQRLSEAQQHQAVLEATLRKQEEEHRSILEIAQQALREDLEFAQTHLPALIV